MTNFWAQTVPIFPVGRSIEQHLGLPVTELIATPCKRLERWVTDYKDHFHDGNQPSAGPGSPPVSVIERTPWSIG
jgi:hypothetical protein